MSDPTIHAHLDDAPDRRIQRPQGAVRARSASSSGARVQEAHFAPYVLDLLGQARPQAHAAMRSLI